jgi:hypothetical protein
MKLKFLPFIRHMSMAMLLSCCTIAVSGQSKTETVTNQTVIDLTKAGLSNYLIISKINTSSVKFDLSSNALVGLKKQGVKDDVIAAMMNKENGTPASHQNASTPAGDLTAINHVHGLINGKLQPLERQHAEAILKLKALGYGGTSQVFNIEGKTSPIRISKADAAKFRINTGGVAPELALYKCIIKGNKRQAEGLRTNAIQARMTGKDLVAFNITQVKEGVFELTPEKPLASGEYFFIGKQIASASRVEAFAFGVD